MKLLLSNRPSVRAVHAAAGKSKAGLSLTGCGCHDCGSGGQVPQLIRLGSSHPTGDSHTCSPSLVSHVKALGLALAVGQALSATGPALAADGSTAATAATTTVAADIMAPPTGAAAAMPGPGSVVPVDPSTYTPSPIDIPEWQLWAGFAAGVIPFAVGAFEFGKRILIQLRCEECNGRGLVKAAKGKYLKKCPECGGFFPWVSWKLFLTSTAAPGNGGPLQQPRGQTSVFYTVPPPPRQQRQQADGGPGDATGAVAQPPAAAAAESSAARGSGAPAAAAVATEEAPTSSGSQSKGGEA